MATEPRLRPRQAHCHRGLAEALAAGGRPQQALAHIAAALTLYNEMRMTRWIDATRAMLARVDRAGRQY